MAILKILFGFPLFLLRVSVMTLLFVLLVVPVLLFVLLCDLAILTLGGTPDNFLVDLADLWDDYMVCIGHCADRSFR